MARSVSDRLRGCRLPLTTGSERQHPIRVRPRPGRKETAVSRQSKWISYDEASKRVGYTDDALRRFAREGKIRTRVTWLPWPFNKELLLREDVEKIRKSMSGGARDWDSGDR
jgi:hypothetical protein